MSLIEFRDISLSHVRIARHGALHMSVCARCFVIDNNGVIMMLAVMVWTDPRARLRTEFTYLSVSFWELHAVGKRRVAVAFLFWRVLGGR